MCIYIYIYIHIHIQIFGVYIYIYIKPIQARISSNQNSRTQIKPPCTALSLSPSLCPPLPGSAYGFSADCLKEQCRSHRLCICWVGESAAWFMGGRKSRRQKFAKSVLRSAKRRLSPFSWQAWQNTSPGLPFAPEKSENKSAQNYSETPAPGIFSFWTRLPLPLALGPITTGLCCLGGTAFWSPGSPLGLGGVFCRTSRPPTEKCG